MPLLLQGAGHMGFQLVAMVLPFLFLPVVTHLMPPQEYGRFALYAMVCGIVMPLALLGMDHLLTYTYFVRSLAEKRALMRASMLLSAGVIFTVELLVLLLLPLLQQQLELGTTALLSLGLVAVLHYLITIGMTVAYMEKNLPLQGVLIVGRIGLAYLVSVPLLLNGLTQWYVLVLGQFAAAGIMAVLALLYLYRQGLMSLAPLKRADGAGGQGIWAGIREVAQNGGPLALFALANVLVGLVDRLMVQHFLGAHGVGLFAVPASLMTGVMLLLIAMTKAVSPQNIRLLSETGAEREAGRQRVALVYLAFGVVIAMMFGMAALVGRPALELLTSATYAEAGVLIVPLAVAMGFNTLFSWHATLLMFEKRGYLLVAMTVVGAALDIGLGWLLIPRFGLAGAGWASALAFCGLALMCTLAMVRLVPLPWAAAARQGTGLLMRRWAERALG